ncbi:MAG: hypothetical protein JRD43_05315 [Deltaproteobacteria bacterium]|nr:hypothetical protein [Deltaproteobacteria bacterium]MBW2595300.1 hypothetical protein [Deltaproteobacteria bacterium]MBW2650340.1 hypothetical protein [Deltaproteobacteria bacterium]
MTKKGITTQSLHGNDKEDCGNDKKKGGGSIGVEDINDLCPQCREELGVMDLLGFVE